MSSGSISLRDVCATTNKRTISGAFRTSYNALDAFGRVMTHEIALAHSTTTCARLNTTAIFRR